MLIFVVTELATLPVGTAYQDESSIFMAMQFNNPAISIAGQTQLLESRGVLFEDRESTLHYLSNISLHSFYAVFICLYYLLQAISPSNQFKNRFKELLYKYPNIDIGAMGFPIDWEEEPLWQSQNSKK